MSDPFYDNVVLLMNFNGNNGDSVFFDESTAGKIVTLAGTNPPVLTNAQVLNGATSGRFYASESGIRVAHDDRYWVFGTEDFTIEAWVYAISLTSNESHILSKHDGGNILFDLDVRSTNYSFRVGGASATVFSGFQTGQWRHLAGVRQGSTIRLYNNGVQVATASFGTGAAPNPSTAPVQINDRSWDVLTRGLNGYIDGVRITRGVCRYPDGTTFTPPTVFWSDFSNRLKTPVRTYLANSLPLTTPVRDTIRNSLNLLAADRSFKQNISFDQYIGNFRVRGSTKIASQFGADVPRQSIVVLMDEVAGIGIRRQVSNATTGAYSFDNIRGDIRYTVVAYDPGGSLNAVIADNIQAEPMT